MNSIVLFGVRSPLLPDYEESCSRLGLTIAAAVRVDALRARILDRSTVTDLSELSEGHDLPGFVACAFNPYRREELTILADKAGLVAAEPLVDATSVVASSTRVGCGTYMNAGVVIGAAGVIGEHVCVSRSTNIGHHGQLTTSCPLGRVSRLRAMYTSARTASSALAARCCRVFASASAPLSRRGLSSKTTCRAMSWLPAVRRRRRAPGRVRNCSARKARSSRARQVAVP